MKIIIISIIIILIILIVFSLNSFYNIHNDYYENFIYGLWTAPESFCEESEISSMSLFIGEAKKIKNKIIRNARILINNNITNQDITLIYKEGSTGFPLKIKPYKIMVNVEFSKESIWKSPIFMEFNLLENSLRIHDRKELLALLYKDNEISRAFTKNKQSGNISEDNDDLDESDNDSSDESESENDNKVQELSDIK